MNSVCVFFGIPVADESKAPGLKDVLNQYKEVQRKHFVFILF